MPISYISVALLIQLSVNNLVKTMENALTIRASVNCRSNICRRIYHFSIDELHLICQKSVVSRSIGSFLRFLFCSIVCSPITALEVGSFHYKFPIVVLKCGIVMLPASLFCCFRSLYLSEVSCADLRKMLYIF